MDPCRMCGEPGRLYMSGRWCDDCSPHEPQPKAPPHNLTPRHQPPPRETLIDTRKRTGRRTP